MKLIIVNLFFSVNILNILSICHQDNEFQCQKDKICIKSEKLCNGYIDCNDGTDELEENCKNIKCAENQWKCNYGGCIDKTKLCNEIYDCHDHSDEPSNLCISNILRHYNNKNNDINKNIDISYTRKLCTIPKPPKHSKILIFEEDRYRSIHAGYLVELNTQIRFKCNDRYHLNGFLRKTCIDGNWYPTALPECVDLDYDFSYEITLKCRNDEDCERNHICYNGKCIYSCEYACGANTICVAQFNQPICKCKEGYQGNPYINCFFNNINNDNKNEVTKIVQCPKLRPPLHGRIKLVVDHFKYEIVPNLNQTDNKETICHVNFNPKYKRFSCFRKQIKTDEFLYYVCNNGYKLIGNSIENCLQSNLEKKCEKINNLLILDKITIDENKTKLDIDKTLEACPIPNIQNGFVMDSLGRKLKGKYVRPSNLVQYNCSNDYALVGESVNRCLNGKWKLYHGRCERTCNNKELLDRSLRTECRDKSKRYFDCNSTLIVGTEVLINCENEYKETENHNSHSICQKSGEWKGGIQKCDEMCGISPWIRNSLRSRDVITLHRVPWHVGIFQYNTEFENYDNICGGTIISFRIVISAAHCFWNQSSRSFFDKNLFKIGFGKSYRDYEAREKKNYYYLNILNIYTDPKYNADETQIIYDISIITVEDYIKYYSHIRPVCVDLMMNAEESAEIREYIGAGKLAGWGKNSDGRYNKELRYMDIDIVDDNECSQNLNDTDLKKYLTYDKFCAGKINGPKNPCDGDSGGGLVIEKKIGDSIEYQLHGVASAGIKKYGGNSICDTSKYSFFTNIYEYICEIKIIENAARIENVVLPNNEITRRCKPEV